MRREVKRALLIGGAVAVLAAIVVASIRTAGKQERVRVYAEKAARRDITRTVKASGQVDPRVKVNISAHVIGKIEKLHVQEGDRIDAGSPFLELEKEAFLAVRDQAAAELEIARSRLRQAEIEVEDAGLRLRRMERLRGEQVASAEDLEAAELRHKSALLALEQGREAVAQAQAALDKARDDLAKTTIFAPLGGRVIALNAEQGEVVVSGTMNNPASVIGTIADLSEVLAEVDVDETEIVYVEHGQKATLEVDALPDRTYRGRVAEIGSSGFDRPQQPDVTFFKVKVLFEEQDERLRPGMSVRAAIETARSAGALVVPIQAVVERPPLADGDEHAGESGEANGESKAPEPADEIKVVFVAEDGKARQRPVETGLSDATHVEVVAGLREGEEVVTGPYRALRDLEDGGALAVRERSDDASERGRRREAGRGRGEDEDGEEDAAGDE